MSTTTERIAANIRAEAARQRIMQCTFAEALGVSRGAMNHRWHGRKPYGLEELETVSRLLNIPIADLWGRREYTTAVSANTLTADLARSEGLEPPTF